MNRRNFLKIGSALPGVAAVGGLSRIAFANPGDAAWRVFEVTTRVHVLDADGATRVWLPAAAFRRHVLFQESRKRLGQ